MSDLSGPHLLPADSYPITLEAFNTAGERVWRRVVVEPETGLAGLHVPPLAELHGPITMRLTFGDGQVETA